MQYCALIIIGNTMKIQQLQYKTMHLLIGCLVIGTSSWAQKINWGTPYEMSSIFNHNEIIQASTERLYVMHKYKDEAYYFRRKISFYNQALEPKTGEQTVNLTHDNLNGRYQFSLALKGQPKICYAVNNVEKETETILVSDIEAASLNVNAKSIKLFEVNYKDKIHDLGGYQYCYSDDHSKCLIYGKMPYVKKANAEIGLYIGDENLEKLVAGKASLTQIAKQVALQDIVDAVIDNQGNAYLLCKLYKRKDKKEEKKQGTRFVYTLICMKKDASIRVLDTLKILEPQDSTIVVSAKLSVNNHKRTATCIGSYKIRGKKAGLFKLNLNDWDTESAVVLDYPATVVQMVEQMPRKLRKRKHLDLGNYKVKTILEEPNGDQLICAEQHYINVYWDKSEGRQELHKLNNILIAKLSTDIVLDWVQVLPKRQKGGGEGYTNVPEKLYSFYSFKKDNAVHILYNDIETNLKINNEYELKAINYNTPKDCSLIHCKIDLASGELLSKKSLSDMRETGIAVYPKKTRLLENGFLLLSGVKPTRGLKEKSSFRFGHCEIQ